ncbi:MAG: hemolysin family protein [Armatimonadota bacterium]
MLDESVQQIAWLGGGIIASLLLGGCYTLGDTALITVRASRIEQLCNEGKRRAFLVKKLIAEPAKHVAAAQVGLSLFAFSSSALAAIAGLEIADLTAAGKPSVEMRFVYVAAVVMFTAFLNLVFVGLVPKALALSSPTNWSIRMAPFIVLSSKVYFVLSGIALWAASVLTKPLGVVARYEPPFITRDELEQIVGETGKTGAIDDAEAEIITRVFTLSEHDARTVMTPRPDVSAIPVTASLSDALTAIVGSGHTRIPVYDGTIDNVVGILHAKDLLKILAEHVEAERYVPDFHLRSILRPAVFVLESNPVPDLLTSMRRNQQQIAIVQDEFAGTEGIVTIEDLLEEIVGDIRDEHDVDEPAFDVDASGKTILDGRMPIDLFNERFSVSLPDDDYNTVGGYVFGAIGRELTSGDSIDIEGIRIIIVESSGRTTTLRVESLDT